MKTILFKNANNLNQKWTHICIYFLCNEIDACFWNFKTMFENFKRGDVEIDKWNFEVLNQDILLTVIKVHINTAHRSGGSVPVGPCIFPQFNFSYFYLYKESNLGSIVNVARDQIQFVVKIQRVAKYWKIKNEVSSSLSI